MSTRTAKPLLARKHPDKFVGRDAELDRLYLRAVSDMGSGSIHLSGRAGTGTSELLRQLYDRLFFEQRFVVPFYYSLNSRDATAYTATANYLYQFVLQAIAFRRQEPGLIASAPDICELETLSPINDVDWISRLCKACKNEGPLNDERSFIRSSLSAPFRASFAGGFRAFVIVDDLHQSVNLENGRVFVDEMVNIAGRSGTQIVLGSRSRYSMKSIAEQRIDVERLDRKSFVDLAATAAADRGVDMNEQSRDLVALKFAGRPRLLESFLEAATSKRVALQSYREVERLYSKELLEGGLGTYFDDNFARAASEPILRQKLYEALYHTIGNGNERFRLETLRERLGVRPDIFGRMIDILSVDEVLDVNTGAAQVSDDEILRDFLIARHRASTNIGSLAVTAAQTVTNALKRAPKLVASDYRRGAALGMTELLLDFDMQRVPRSLLDYRLFRENLKGLSASEARSQIAKEGEQMTLPLVAHAAPIVDHLPEFGEPTEPDRAVIAVGFADRSYSDESEIVWFAAEIDSKLEADYSLTREWVDRLDTVADKLGYSEHKIWLIAPEGFSDGALDLLAEQGGFGSSRKQAQLLREFLHGGSPAKSEAYEYEIVIPIGEETELIAVHAFEEIARKYAFPPKAVNQIKTALVEACINAAEHSLSPDGKIKQRFSVDEEKVVIIVSNRGMRLTDRMPIRPEAEGDDKRRGWGLGLIRSLMDEVRIESVDDGTQITMVKLIKPSA
ncbi:MAG: hypothetical protein DMF62_04110 [Acidobacteria bacterium]|nr:MAG: hypothetical protein DMF62_04110 [Acidobacteriota bacterium]